METRLLEGLALALFADLLLTLGAWQLTWVLSTLLPVNAKCQRGLHVHPLVHSPYVHVPTPLCLFLRVHSSAHSLPCVSIPHLLVECCFRVRRTQVANLINLTAVMCKMEQLLAQPAGARRGVSTQPWWWGAWPPGWA